MSYVLAAGCSYTDDDFRFWQRKNQSSEEFEGHECETIPVNWIKWPHLFADYVNLPCVNIARSGGDNPGMIDDIFDYIAFNNKKPEYICILLSEWIRQNFLGAQVMLHTGFRLHVLEQTRDGNHNSPYDTWWVETDYDKHKRYMRDLKHGWSARMQRARDSLSFETICGAHTKQEDKIYTSKSSHVRFLQRVHTSTFRRLLHLINYCNENNIKLLIAQGLGVEGVYWYVSVVSQWLKRNGFDNVSPSLKPSLEYMMWAWEKCKDQSEIELFLSNPYFEKLEGEYKKNSSNINLIGWPWLPQIGGYTLCQRSVNKDWTDEKIIEGDGHPNATGHKYLANYFINEYEKMK